MEVLSKLKVQLECISVKQEFAQLLISNAVLKKIVNLIKRSINNDQCKIFSNKNISSIKKLSTI